MIDQDPCDRGTRRELRLAEGRLVQCDCCGSIGFEFGTVYLIFDALGFLHFAIRCQQVLANLELGPDTLYLRLGETHMMLVVSREERPRLQRLLERGLAWLDPPPQTRPAPPPHQEAVVH